MPRSQGFARGDIDTAFPLDDKFLALRGRLLTERYYAATGVYFTVVAATWREAERKIALRVAPDAADLIDELVAVGLLDSDGRLPNRAFTSWIGRARRQRKVSAERQARNRAGKSRSVTRDTSVTNGESPPARASAPLRSEGTVGTETEGGPGETDALDTYHELTLYRPWGVWSGDKLRGAIVDYGDATVSAALRAEHDVDPNRGSLLDRALARLAKDAERTKRERKDKPRPLRPKANDAERDALIKEYMTVVKEAG